MKLKCRINGKEYDIVQGASFTDNLNETLDSGTICIDQVPEITELKPYDDVYIWDSSEEFEGYYNKGDWISVETDILKEISSYGDGETTSFGYGEYDSITHNAICSLSPLPYTPNKYVLQGSAVSIFIDMMENGYTILTRNNFRYSLPMIRISGMVPETDGSGMAYLKTITLTLIKNNNNDYVFEGYDNEKTYTISCELNNETKSISFYNDCVEGDIFYKIKNLSLYNGNLIEKNGFHRFFSVDFGTKFELNCKVQDFVISVQYRGRWYDFNATFNDPNEELQGPSSRLAPPGGSSIRTPLFVSNNLLNIHTVFEMYYDRDSKKYNLSITQPRYGSILDLIDDIKINTIVVQSHLGSPLPQKFFKHMLVDNFNHVRLNLGNELRDERVLYRYTINLFSEIKKLEKIILPNTTITQSLVVEEKRTCWEYLQNFVELYSPKYKKVVNGEDKKWQYVQKYSLSENFNEYLEKEDVYGKKSTQYITNLKEVFENTICPEMSWTSPSLRDVLNQFFSVKDLIPVVFNDVIYGLNIGALDENLPNFDRTGVNFDTGSMSSSDYATDARREYGGALSQENSAHMIEYMGFRSPNSAFLNLSTMVLETRFPIYKINTIKICYYKRFTLQKGESGPTITKTFLCKHDITPLILQNTVRGTLSTNFEVYQKISTGEIDYSNITSQSAGRTVREKLSFVASKSQLCTLGYDIGSNVITGWGTTYEYLDFAWFKANRSYLENIIRLLDVIDETGSDIFSSVLQEYEGKYSINCESGGGIRGIIPFKSSREETEEQNIANKLKSIVFEVDYDAMYSGAVVHSKDFIEDDDITTVDNCSTSLAVLETDGLFEKEKLNRMSNKQFKFTARYDERTGGALYSNIQELGTLDRDYTNATIYSREYQIYDTCILANYSASYNYILKNYFTSVWAKYRTYSFMSYGESVKRTENRREFILLSEKNKYFEEDEILSNCPSFLGDMVSFLLPSNINVFGEKDNLSQINCGYFTINGKKYLSDINSFASGNALCFNIAMSDNISGGTYIQSLSTSIHFASAIQALTDAEKLKADYSATQGWYNFTNSKSDAFVKNVGFYVGHLDKEGYFGDTIIVGDRTQVENGQIFMSLPLLLDNSINFTTHLIGKEFTMLKDNKERIDFTYQFNFITDSKNKIMISPWAVKLNDLIGFYRKYETYKEEYTKLSDTIACDIFMLQDYESEFTPPRGPDYSRFGKHIVFKVKQSDFAIINNGLNAGKNIKFVNTSVPDGSFYLSIPYQKRGYHSESGYYNDRNTLHIAEMTFNGIERRIVTNPSGQTISSSVCLKASTQFNILHKYHNISIGINENSEQTTPLQVYKDFYIDLSYAKTVEQDGINYDYYLGVISYEKFYAGITQAGLTNPQCYALISYLMGDRNLREEAETLDDSNSLHITGMIDLDASEKKTVQTNMVVMTSTQKMNENLMYDNYRSVLADEETGHTDILDLPAHLKVMATGYKGIYDEDYVQNGLLISEVFVPNVEDGTLIVCSKQFDSSVQSVQYYYKDDNGYLHFVFGVNIDKDEAGNNKDMTIYLSCISKRSMKVYDNNHNVIGYAANYADPDNTFQYGTGQYYKEVE